MNKKYNRIYNIDHDYFKKIDSADKAYFLGLLYADGNLSNTQTSFSIGLIYSDLHILDKLKKSINYEGDVKLRKRKLNKGSFTGSKDQVILTINDYYNYNHLLNLGLFPKKSLCLKFPTEEQVPNNFIKDFIRGYLDGDGGIFKTKNKRSNVFTYILSFEGTKEFLNSLEEQIKNLPFSLYFVYSKRRKNETNNYSLKISGKDIDKLLNYFYQNSNLYLERKYKKYLECFEYYKIRENLKIEKNKRLKNIFLYSNNKILIQKYNSLENASRVIGVSSVTIRKYTKSGQCYKNKYYFSNSPL